MILARTDWSRMALGPYPHEYSALPEMYCLWPKGETAGWHEPATYWHWRADSHWRVDSVKGKRCLRQVMPFTENVNSVLVKGDIAWRDYTVTARFSCEAEPRFVGVLCRYVDSFNYYAVVLDGDRLRIVRKCNNALSVLGEAAGTRRRGNLRMSVSCRRDRLSASLGGTPVLEVRDPALPAGKAGLIAATPVTFSDFRVECGPAEAARLRREAAAQARRRAATRRKYSPMRLWKEVRFGDYTGGKSFRFGDLNGDGAADVLVGQLSRKDRLACLTALDLNGNVLWQRGKPVADPLIATTDAPMQIVDFDGRGRNDVITAMDGEILLLDGATGEVRRRGALPDHPPKDETPVHVMGASWFGDCLQDGGAPLSPSYIRVCNLTGRERGYDFICGYGYPYLWGYGNDLKRRWQYTGNVGHCAYAYDTDGDGRDEILAGYSFLRPDGRWVFSLHLGDHADAALIMPHNHPAGEGRLTFVEAAGDDGLLLFDDQGWFRQLAKGHTQRLSIGKFRADLPGLQYAVVTYHGNPGVYTIYDRDGVEVFSREMPACGSNLQPVNWTGDGEELILFCGHREIGGLMDARGDIVVEFPDKDHPQLWCEAINLAGDARDEVLVFDRERLRIYTPAEPFRGRRIYAPRRPPLWNWSNFMAHYSYPAWRSVPPPE